MQISLREINHEFVNVGTYRTFVFAIQTPSLSKLIPGVSDNGTTTRASHFDSFTVFHHTPISHCCQASALRDVRRDERFRNEASDR